MTVTVPVIYREGRLQLMEAVTLPENQPMQATLEFNSSISSSSNEKSNEERVAAFIELVERLSSRNVQPLPESAFDRESFYED